MNAPSLFNRSNWTRRLIVTLAIGSAAAAVTANVAFNEPSAAQRAATGTHDAQSAAAPGEARRVEWRDPWLHPTPPDVSLPAADKALAGSADAAADGSPTF
jgi:hypothetical protein